MSPSKGAVCNPGQEENDKVLSPIQKFYEDANIFVTGCTGFIGILLLEKLLFSCPNISHIYVLIRDKKGKGVQTRLDEILDSEVFFRLKEACPNFKEKILPVEGDCSLPDMGISDQDMKMLKREVNIIFHCAATVRFDESLKKAFYINVRAVRDILRLAQQTEHLKSMVHVSTAYSNCVKKYIEEKVYPPAMEYTDILNIIKLPDDIVTSMTSMLLGEYPNTYSFTKQIGEDVVKTESKGLPVGIHRPSVVIPTYKEPIPGWTNNINGGTGCIAGVGMGLIRTLNFKEYEVNMVSGDMVVNSIIASAWDIANNFSEKINESNDIPVYNFEGSQAPKITLKKFTEDQREYLYKYIPSRCLWYPFYFVIESRIVYLIAKFFLHTLPSYVVDGVLACLGKPPMLTPIYGKIHKMLDVLQYFYDGEWNFQTSNTDMLKIRMSDKDKIIFFMDVKELEWKSYLEIFDIGVRIYILKDPLTSLPEAEKRLKRLYLTHLATVALLVLLLLWISWIVLQFVF